jgi:hypothetical protein
MSIEVITDPAAVAAARDAYRRRIEHDLSEALKRPSSVKLDARGLELLRANRTRAIDAMTRIRDDAKQEPRQRLFAMIVLKALEVEPIPRLIAQLAAADEETLIELLIHAEALYPLDRPLPDEVRRTFVQAVEHGGRPLEWANGVAADYRLTETLDTMLARLKPGDRVHYVVALRPTVETFELLQRWLREAIAKPPLDPDKLYDVDERPSFHAGMCVIGMIVLAEATADPALRDRAANEAIAFLKAPPAHFDAQDFQTDLDFASRIQPRELALRIQTEVARGARDRILRECALTGVFEFDQSLARRIAAEANTELKVGAVAEDAGPGDDAILGVLLRHGVITADEADRAKTAPDKPLDMGGAPSESDFVGQHVGPVGIVLSKLRRYLFLDANGDDIPNRNDLFLLKLVPPSIGRFNPEAALETYSEPIEEGGDGSYEVQFVHGDRLYRFHPWDHYTEMDLDAIVAAANRAIADTGAAERFIRIAPDAAFAHYAFATPEPLAAAAKELNLAIAE